MILLAIGAKYSSYCANIARSLLIDSTKHQEKVRPGPALALPCPGSIPSHPRAVALFALSGNLCGRPVTLPAAAVQVYKALLRAQEAVIAALRPGARLADVYQVTAPRPPPPHAARLRARLLCSADI